MAERLFDDVSVWGKRPDGMSYEEYRERRDMTNWDIKQYLKGTRITEPGPGPNRKAYLEKVKRRRGSSSN